MGEDAAPLFVTSSIDVTAEADVANWGSLDVLRPAALPIEFTIYVEWQFVSVDFCNEQARTISEGDWCAV